MAMMSLRRKSIISDLNKIAGNNIDAVTKALEQASQKAREHNAPLTKEGVVRELLSIIAENGELSPVEKNAKSGQIIRRYKMQRQHSQIRGKDTKFFGKDAKLFSKNVVKGGNNYFSSKHRITK
ncbi:hypothetical protein [Hyphococcus sp.]|uniref:hypothetical protein n=1 Tax=Hyphococcus sp. TaxID=2038636 RepID=UPI0035C69B14